MNPHFQSNICKYIRYYPICDCADCSLNSLLSLYVMLNQRRDFLSFPVKLLFQKALFLSENKLNKFLVKISLEHLEDLLR